MKHNGSEVWGTISLCIPDVLYKEMFELVKIMVLATSKEFVSHILDAYTGKLEWSSYDILTLVSCVLNLPSYLFVLKWRMAL